MGRSRLPYNALAFTATCMLLINPWCLWDVGFQMSFVAVNPYNLPSCLQDCSCKMARATWRCRQGMVAHGVVVCCTGGCGAACAVLFWTLLLLFSPCQLCGCSSCHPRHLSYAGSFAYLFPAVCSRLVGNRCVVACFAHEQGVGFNSLMARGEHRQCSHRVGATRAYIFVLGLHVCGCRQALESLCVRELSLRTEAIKTVLSVCLLFCRSLRLLFCLSHGSLFSLSLSLSFLFFFCLSHGSLFCLSFGLLFSLFLCSSNHEIVFKLFVGTSVAVGKVLHDHTMLKQHDA